MKRIKTNNDIKLPPRLKLGEDKPVHRDDQFVYLYHGDALEVLRKLPDGSVDCIFTSVPYWRIRDYGLGLWKGGRKDCDHIPPKSANGCFASYADECGKCGAKRVSYPLGMERTPKEFVDNLCALFDEAKRVLKDTGSLWVNLGDTYAGKDKQVPSDEDLPAGCQWNIPHRFANAMTDEHGWVLRNTLIWQKPSISPSGVKSRFMVDYEPVFFFTKKSSGYWFDQATVEGKTVAERPARSIFSVHTGENLFGHDSAFPEGIVIPAILSSCPPDGTVLDMFHGTGTTGLVAAYYGRNAIGIELNRDYWVQSAGRIAKVAKCGVSVFEADQGVSLPLPITKKTAPVVNITATVSVAPPKAKTPKQESLPIPVDEEGFHFFELGSITGDFIVSSMKGDPKYRVVERGGLVGVIRLKDGVCLDRQQVKEVRKYLKRKARRELAAA